MESGPARRADSVALLERIRDLRSLSDPARLAARLDPDGFVIRAHLAVISAGFAEVVAGRCDRLMLMCPPQTGKSTLSAQWAPFWWLVRHPSAKIVIASYSDRLVHRHGRAIRRMITTHGARFGLELRRDSTAANDFELTSGGAVRAVSIGGQLTGSPADLLILDDPHKDRAEADSSRIRDNIWDWLSAVAFTRLSPGAPAVLMQTRWHPDDTSARLLARDGDTATGGRWRVVAINALAGPGDPLGREPGEPMPHPGIDPDDRERMLAHWLDKRATSTARDWAALFQNDPQPPEGALTSEALWRSRTISRNAAPDPSIVAVAVDPSGGGRDTAGIIGGFLGVDGRLYLSDDVSGVMSSERWASEACLLADRIDAGRIVIEKNYGGDMAALLVRSAWNELVRAGRVDAARLAPRIVEVTARRGKLLRAEPVAAQLAQDRIRMVGWLPELVHEWDVWQPDDPDSPGRIDASVHLAMSLLRPESAGQTIASPVDVNIDDVLAADYDGWDDGPLITRPGGF